MKKMQSSIHVKDVKKIKKNIEKHLNNIANKNGSIGRNSYANSQIHSMKRDYMKMKTEEADNFMKVLHYTMLYDMKKNEWTDNIKDNYFEKKEQLRKHAKTKQKT